jgi:hypothetical protein
LWLSFLVVGILVVVVLALAAVSVVVSINVSKPPTFLVPAEESIPAVNKADDIKDFKALKNTSSHHHHGRRRTAAGGGRTTENRS